MMARRLGKSGSGHRDTFAIICFFLEFHYQELSVGTGFSQMATLAASERYQSARALLSMSLSPLIPPHTGTSIHSRPSAAPYNRQ